MIINKFTITKYQPKVGLPTNRVLMCYKYVYCRHQTVYKNSNTQNNVDYKKQSKINQQSITKQQSSTPKITSISMEQIKCESLVDFPTQNLVFPFMGLSHY